jgi:hypothetical protein
MAMAVMAMTKQLVFLTLREGRQCKLIMVLPPLMQGGGASVQPPLPEVFVGATAEAGCWKPGKVRRRMRLYRCRLDIRACHPASEISVTG